jgi:hypothetical protein
VIHRAPIALAVALAAAAFAVGCRSSETVPEGPDAGERLDSKELQDLIARGAVRPVEQAPPQGSPATPADWQNAEALAERDALARAEKRIADVRAVQPPEAGPPPSQPPLVPGNEFPSEPENPYLLFGKRIQVYPDSGLIMKPFPLRAGTGKTLTKLLQDYGNFPLWEPGEEKQAKDQVRMELVEKWDQELFSDMRQSVPKEDTVLPVADWVIIVTGLERRKEVEGCIISFAARVPPLYVRANFTRDLALADLDWLCGATRLPVVVKGVCRGEDARAAAEHGAKAVVVSNHGGRQLDTAPATSEVLPRVAEAAGDLCEIYVDGGIRRGADVLKAIALGARAVLVGRPILWGLAVDGEAGAQQLLEILRRELDEAMLLCGCPKLSDIGRWALAP